MVGQVRTLRIAAVLLLVFDLCNSQGHVVKLNLESMRGHACSDPGEREAHTLLEKVSIRPDGVYCTDSVYPNDIFCDLSNELIHYQELTSVSLEYAHPMVRGSTCTVNFLLWNSASRLQHQGVRCSGGAPALPMTRVAYVLKIYVRIASPGEQFRCTRTYSNSGKMSNLRILSVLGRRRAPLRFTFYGESCTE